MGTACFKANAFVVLDGREHQLVRLLDDHTWQVEDCRTKRITEHKRADLQQALAQGRLIFISRVDVDKRAASLQVKATALAWLRPEAFRLAKMRRAYVMAVIDSPMTKKHVEKKIKAVWERLKEPETCPCFSTVSRWRKVYLANNRDITKLIDGNDGNFKPRKPADLYRIVKSAVDTVWMTEERKTIQDALDAAIHMVTQENYLRPARDQLSLPSFRFVKRLVYRIPAFDRIAARYGREAAMRRFRTTLKKSIATAPLERAEMDHTQLNMLVVDERTSLPCGRPWITVCIDVYTRCILGIYIGFEPPSYLTVARCLKHAILPKASIEQDFPGVEYPWNAHGVMTTLVVDNGREFHSDALEQACFSLGIDIEYCPRATPWAKGIVERVQGTLNRGTAQGMPGTTFANALEKEDYDPSEHAVITLTTLRKIVVQWIANYYHQRTHSALKTSPAAMWDASIKPEDIPVPDDPARFDAILGKAEQYTLSHSGITRDGLRYSSPELNQFRLRHGEKLRVDIRVDPADLTSIVVFSPDKSSYLRVACIDKDYVNGGLSEWQHKVCKRHRATQFPNLVGPAGLAKAKADIARIIQEEMRSGRAGGRGSSRAKRFQEAGGPSDPGKLPPSSAALQTGSVAPAPPVPQSLPALPSPAARSFEVVIETDLQHDEEDVR